MLSENLKPQNNNLNICNIHICITGTRFSSSCHPREREREREGERVSLSAHTIITTSTREIYREDDFLDFSKASMVWPTDLWASAILKLRWN